MLHLIFSRAGYGKTNKIYKLIKTLADNGMSDMVLLVPEQASFESERDTLRLLSAAQAHRVDVLSFTRLADVFFDKFGGKTKRCIDATGKAAIMELTLKNLASELTLYKKQAALPQFAKHLLSFSEQIKRAAITPEMLLSQSQLSTGTLKLKLHESALIFSEYEQRLNTEFYDPLDDLTKLSEMLPQNRFFENKTVFIDSFKGFTAQQINVLDKIIAQAGEVYITFGCDTAAAAADEMSVFRNVNKTASAIKNIAKKNNVKIAKDEYLTENMRAKNDELKEMEMNLFSVNFVQYEQPTQFVSVCKTKTVYDEADYVASTIHRLVRTKGYRYRDFAVIARQTTPYMGIIDSAFMRHNIPFFIDGRNPVDSKAIFKLVSAAYSAVLNRFDTDDVLAVLKTGLTDISADGIALLDNYCAVWEINYDEWLTEWTGNPNGLDGDFDEAAAKTLKELNQMRGKIVSSLEKLKNGINSNSAKDISAAIYKFILDVRADKNLLEYSKSLDERGNVLLADEERRSYDVLINLLDQLVMALSGTETDKTKYFELFTSAAELCDIGSLPQGLDEVAIGSAERMRPASPKVTFVVGANEGVFPANLQTSGIFTDSEIKSLRENGIELPDYAEDKAIDENYLAYTALCSPSERLYVSYQTADTAGNALMPSQIVTMLTEIFLSCTEVDDRTAYSPEQALDKIECVSAAASLLAREYANKTTLYSSIEKYFEQNGSSEYAAVKNASQQPEIRLTPATASELYGKNIITSATRTDTFYKCRFSYFCKYGIRVNPLKTAKIDVTNRGTIMHYVLEKAVCDYSCEYILSLSDSELKELVTQLVNSYFDTLTTFNRKMTSRQQFIINSLINTFTQVVRRVFSELEQTDFSIAATEQAIGDDGVERLEVTLDNGSKVILNGKIDRVDLLKKDGQTYIRIIDYKTGEREVSLSDVIRGQSLQMLVYMIALQKGGKGKFGSELLPAGILYMPAKDKILSDERFADDKSITDKINSGLKMKGFLLNDMDSINGMEPSGAGVFIPAKLNKDGSVAKRSPVYTLEQFGKLSKHIEKLLKQMGETLLDGDISINPTDSKNGSACKYCDYRTICRRDENEKNNANESMTNEEVFEWLGGDDNGI